MAQLVQLVDVLVLVQIVVQSQHIAVKAGNKHFAVPLSVYPDFCKGGLYLLCGRGEMDRCSYFNPHHGVQGCVGYIGFKHGLNPPFRPCLPALHKSQP